MAVGAMAQLHVPYLSDFGTKHLSLSCSLVSPRNPKFRAVHFVDLNRCTDRIYSSLRVSLQNNALRQQRTGISHHKPFNSEKYAVSDGSLSVVDVDNVPREALSPFVFEASSDAHLQAASNLRVRTFYYFGQTYNIEEHRKFLAKLEFEALKERIEGKRLGYKRVACVVATIFISDFLHPNNDVLSLCKVNVQMGGMFKEQLVVGSLDLIQTLRLPEEICGSRPQGYEAYYCRAYLANVCVAKELRRKGIGASLIKHAKKIAQLWGISDLYIHVITENEAARRLYEKNGFVKEKEEKPSEARLMGRPRRLLLWHDLKNVGEVR